MNPYLRIAAISLALWSGFANAQEVHLISQGATVKEALSPTRMQERVAAAAQEYQKYKQVARIALFDVAYPKDAEEFNRTSGYGVILVVSQSQTSAELPPKRVFLRSGATEVDLVLLSSASLESAPNSLEKTVLGPYRWEGVYMFPVGAQSAGTELVLDYQINRAGFVLTRFHSTGTASAGFDAEVPASSGGDEGSKGLAIATLVAREFPGFAVR